jgi:hypothetical protein
VKRSSTPHMSNSGSLEYLKEDVEIEEVDSTLLKTQYDKSH